MNGRNWTLEEEQIIHKYYRDERSKGVRKRMPYRTIGSIHAKAYSMGIQFYQKKAPFKQWSHQEIKILKQFYPLEGAHCCKRLPNRTKKAVRFRASMEGLTQNTLAIWSQEEIDTLKKNTGVGQKKLQELLPNRTWQAIRRKIVELKMRGEIILPKRDSSWTPEEVALLQQYYPIEGIECQKRLPNRSKSAIQFCAQDMGLVKPLGTWSVAENEILRKNAQLTAKALQELLPGRTSVAINAQKAQLGLSKKTCQSWSSEEDAILRRYYPTEGLECKKHLPNRTRRAIIERTKFLAIKRIQTEAWTTEELKILEQFYPIEGANCYKRLPNRTKSAVKHHASKQDLTQKRRPKWSVEEIDILRKNTGVTAKKLQKLLPNRTWEAIGLKRVALKMHDKIFSSKEPSSWTPEEVAILQQYYPIEGLECQKRLPNRNKRIIQLYAQKMGLGKSPGMWSVEENEKLKKNLQLTNKALEKLLPGRTETAISRQKTQLGLTQKIQLWSSEEEAILRRYYPTEGLECKKRLPNRTHRAIKDRVARLGLMNTKPKAEWSQTEIDILKKNMTLTPKALQKLLPGRTKNAIAVKQRPIKMQLKMRGESAPED